MKSDRLADWLSDMDDDERQRLERLLTEYAMATLDALERHGYGIVVDPGRSLLATVEMLSGLVYEWEGGTL